MNGVSLGQFRSSRSSRIATSSNFFSQSTPRSLMKPKNNRGYSFLFLCVCTTSSRNEKGRKFVVSFFSNRKKVLLQWWLRRWGKAFFFSFLFPLSIFLWLFVFQCYHHTICLVGKQKQEREKGWKPDPPFGAIKAVVPEVHKIRQFTDFEAQKM